MRWKPCPQFPPQTKWHRRFYLPDICWVSARGTASPAPSAHRPQKCNPALCGRTAEFRQYGAAPSAVRFRPVLPAPERQRHRRHHQKPDFPSGHINRKPLWSAQAEGLLPPNRWSVRAQDRLPCRLRCLHRQITSAKPEKAPAFAGIFRIIQTCSSPMYRDL